MISFSTASCYNTKKYSIRYRRFYAYVTTASKPFQPYNTQTLHPEDCEEISILFYETVHTVNAKDYSRQQLDVWAT